MSHLSSISSTNSLSSGTKDGQGASDHDQPYEFHRRPRALAPYPFRVRQYAHLLILRGRIEDGSFARDDTGASRLPLRRPARLTCPPSPWCRCVDCGAHAPLPPELGRPMRCSTCEQTHSEGEVVDAILCTALSCGGARDYGPAQ